LVNKTNTTQDYIDLTSWRYPTFIASIWIPIVVLVIDLCLNRIWLKLWHILYSVFVYSMYVFFTVVG